MACDGFSRPEPCVLVDKQCAVANLVEAIELSRVLRYGLSVTLFTLLDQNTYVEGGSVNCITQMNHRFRYRGAKAGQECSGVDQKALQRDGCVDWLSCCRVSCDR